MISCEQVPMIQDLEQCTHGKRPKLVWPCEGNITSALPKKSVVSRESCDVLHSSSHSRSFVPGEVLQWKNRTQSLNQNYIVQEG